jgi:hypothetical protein
MLHFVIFQHDTHIPKILIPEFREETDMIMLIHVDSKDEQVMGYSINSDIKLWDKIVKQRNMPTNVSKFTSKVDVKSASRMIESKNNIVVHSELDQKLWLAAILGVLVNIHSKVDSQEIKDQMIEISDIFDKGEDYFSGSSISAESGFYIKMSENAEYNSETPIDDMPVSSDNQSFEIIQDDADPNEETEKEEGELKSDEETDKADQARELMEKKRKADRTEDDTQKKKPKGAEIISDEDKFLEMITLISDATVYEGFSPTKVRSNFIGSHPDVKNYTQNLSMIFIAYARIGNNIGKLNQKRVDPVKATELMRAVEALGMKKKAIKSDTLTLPRMAIAFMPEYLVFRKNLMKDLQIQADTTLNVVYQDVAFAGCDQISSMVGYTEFYDQFSRLITNNGKGVAADDKAEKNHIAAQAGWRKVATTGYRQDSLVGSRMVTAMSVSDAKSAINFIAASHIVY